jgi:hypothetical protein
MPPGAIRAATPAVWCERRGQATLAAARCLPLTRPGPCTGRLVDGGQAGSGRDAPGPVPLAAIELLPLLAGTPWQGITDKDES